MTWDVLALGAVFVTALFAYSRAVRNWHLRDRQLDERIKDRWQDVARHR